MTKQEFINKIVNDINIQSQYVAASVDSRGNLVLTAKSTDVPVRTAELCDGAAVKSTGTFADKTYGLRVIGNEGDTYFQRWDSVKTVPASTEDENQVVDLASVMIESHINLDGRYDRDRGITKLTTIDWSNFGPINRVYSQSDNFRSGIDYDESLNLDSYPSSIMWTLAKASNAEIDEWTHITTTSSLALDGDKGPVQALRRFQNSILAFQDKGISEILFNSRTQLTTEEGVPVEIANSGKVDGKRYISGKYGTTNKWSITEGKFGLYFVDNINKAFCTFNGSGVDNLSEKLGFGAWFRSRNTVKSWTPEDYDNIVSYYDKVHSEIYLVKAQSDEEAPSLVYSEILGAFTSFYDYGSVPMMVNVDDMFISFRDNCLWLQNMGLYCSFFGRRYDWWTSYRAVPDPYGDKIWTNLEYRTDAYRVLDEDGGSVVSENELIDGGEYADYAGIYQKDSTFDDIEVWNEYQRTSNLADRPVKKFRTWRLAIPRAAKTETNKYGLDRIRNPWVNVLFKRSAASSDGRDMTQLHDIIIKYFE